ncbi:MAG: type II secretion system protein [Candidatus Omnitrophota bacterium]
MKLKSKAFTLIEVLLVSTLIAIVGIAVFQALSNGIKLWAKAQRLNREAEVAIFLDKMGEDLRSVPIISGIPFKGTDILFSFPAVVMTKADSKSSRSQEGFISQIGAVQYRFDPVEHTVFRRQANYAQAIKRKWAQQENPEVLGIDELDFHYEIASDKGLLLKSEIGEGIPLGVMVEVYFSDDSGKHQLKRYLSLLVRG